MDARLVTLSAFFPSTDQQFRETAWLTFGCLKRFLTASGNNVKKALNKVRMAMDWKNINQVWNILQPFETTAHFIQSAAKSGHLHVLQKPDTNGRAGVVYRPAVTSEGSYEAQLRLLVYTMERACFIAGENKIVLIVDAADVTLRNIPSIRMIRDAATILIEIYPERLGKVFVLNASLKFRTLVSVIFNLIPKLPGRKLYFLGKEESEIFNSHPDTFGYDHDDYFNNFTPPKPLRRCPFRTPFE